MPIDIEPWYSSSNVYELIREKKAIEASGSKYVRIIDEVKKVTIIIAISITYLLVPLFVR